MESDRPSDSVPAKLRELHLGSLSPSQSESQHGKDVVAQVPADRRSPSRLSSGLPRNRMEVRTFLAPTPKALPQIRSSISPGALRTLHAPIGSELTRSW